MGVRPELLIVNDEVVAVRLSGREFPCEPETGESIIPKKLLTGFRLSEIPEDLTIKLEDSMDIALSSFADGSASVLVEVMERRKH